MEILSPIASTCWTWWWPLSRPKHVVLLTSITDNKLVVFFATLHCTFLVRSKIEIDWSILEQKNSNIPGSHRRKYHVYNIQAGLLYVIREIIGVYSGHDSKQINRVNSQNAELLNFNSGCTYINQPTLKINESAVRSWYTVFPTR